MSHPFIARLLAAALVLPPGQALADEVVLDVDGAMAAAAANAPAIVAARGRLGEARATRVGADLRFPDNPELELEAGPRRAAATTVDVGVQLGQTFRPGGRGARRAVADAEVTLADAVAEATVREVRLEAGLAFVDALYAARVVAAAGQQAELAGRAAEVADRRRVAGDLTDLEAALARAAAGRARAGVSAAEAEQAAALGRLAATLGLAADDTVVLRGELRADQPRPTATVEAAVDDRADLRALAAEGRLAAAEGRLARAEAKPELGLWLGYHREEDADVVLAGLRVSWPLWNRGQGPAAVARARSSRVAATYEVARRGAARQLVDARAVHERARLAVERFEAEVLPALDASEALLGRSVDAGTLAVADYLLARQEVLAGRREYLDLLLALARARVTAELAAEGAS